MIFSTPAFLFLFLPPVLLLSFCLRRQAQNVFLLLASLLFYSWGEGGFVLLLLGSALANHLFGLALGRGSSAKRRKAILGLGLGFNLALLAGFKYLGFILANIVPLLRAAGLPGDGTTAWHQPLGISFFTFMAIAYLVEVYNRAVPAERNIVHTALFISFFPTVLAGPIHRYSLIGQQLAERRTTPEDAAEGVRRFIIGLGKKVLLADTLARTAEAIFAIPVAGLNAPIAWLGAASYTLQIFLDFSGYTDMAIGLGRMFGFRFMENFKSPYVSRSITEFWTRWHISLSTWLRDFLFLPLAYAVSRRVKADRWLGIRADSWSYYPAMFVTMLLCGLWHGAAWTFVAWGAVHGLFIMAERLALKRVLRRLGRPLQSAYALLAVTFAWVLFRADSFAHAAGFWRSMLGWGRGDGREHYLALYLDRETLLVLAISCLAAASVGPALKRAVSLWRERTPVRFRPWLAGAGRGLAVVMLAALLLASAMRLALATYNPFIYFRF